jgi:tellurite resistance protein TerC
MGTPLLWLAFNLFIVAAIAADLGVLHRRAHRLSLREAALWTALWVALSVAFGFAIARYAGQQKSLEFFTGYVIEKALSVDNLFLFLVIFRAFRVDESVQHRILEWGIFGALLMRGLMIALGAELIRRFEWILYLLGGFLVFAGLHMFWARKREQHPERSAVSSFASKHLRVAVEGRGAGFFVRQNGKLFATPLLVVLLIIEVTDITLAVDSIPAIFGITRDAFLVYTSNVFAILGLRAMYFLLAGVLNRLRFLTVGLSVVLVFIGGKMIAEPWLHISTANSLAIVAGILLAALIPSLRFRDGRNLPAAGR